MRSRTFLSNLFPSPSPVSSSFPPLLSLQIFLSPAHTYKAPVVFSPSFCSLLSFPIWHPCYSQEPPPTERYILSPPLPRPLTTYPPPHAVALFPPPPSSSRPMSFYLLITPSWLISPFPQACCVLFLEFIFNLLLSFSHDIAREFPNGLPIPLSFTTTFFLPSDQPLFTFSFFLNN